MTIEHNPSPKVTIVLFCYNSEKYIKKAVTSVLSQDYAKLRVVVSDDCSTDNTFLYAKAILDRYTGHHEVVLRRNEANLGLIEHVNLVMSQVDTELVVVAAGDDISLPNRVSKIVDIYLNFGMPKLISSTAFRIDLCDNLLDGYAPGAAWAIHDINSVVHSLTNVDSRIGLYLGATGAWTTNLWNKFGPIRYEFCWEDVVMGFRASIEKSYYMIDEPLVKYRVNHGLSSQTSKSIAGMLVLRSFNLKLRRDIAKQRLIDISLASQDYRDAFCTVIATQVLKHSIRASLYQSPQTACNYLRNHPRLFIIEGFSEVIYLVRVFVKTAFRILK